jgi:hypothetical protein
LRRGAAGCLWVVEGEPRLTRRITLWCKEGWARSVLGEYAAQKQALSRFFIGAAVLSETVLDVIRWQLRRASPDVRIENEQISAVLVNEVIKREVMEGDKADEAKRKLSRAAGKSLRASSKDGCEGDGGTNGTRIGIRGKSAVTADKVPSLTLGNCRSPLANTTEVPNPLQPSRYGGWSRGMIEPSRVAAV